MRILIIRHGDPDYTNDTLTEKGVREAELLCNRLANEKIDYVYCSPLGRARKTCEIATKGKNLEAEIVPWLKEFGYSVQLPTGEKHIIWDLLPAMREQYPDLAINKSWLSVPFIKNSPVPERYAELKDGLDKLLNNHGYAREGAHYRVERANRDTIAFFCHFGVEAMILSHFLNVVPDALLHGFIALPTSVTTLYTEERRKSVAVLRCCEFGDTAHLYSGNEEPSFSGRFCEVFDSDERKD